MPVLEDRLLSLGAKNSTVYAFEQLVNNCIGINSITSQNRSNNTLPVRRIAELTQELYNKAASLPEAQSVSFKYLDNASKFQYGNFKGGNTYKTFNGDVDSNNKNAKPQHGWIILDRSSSEYCLFTNNDKSLIIAIADFEPTPIIEDFTPLYEKLCQQKYSGSNTGLYADDIRSAYALAVTFRLEVSILLTNKLYQAWLIFMNAYRLVGEFSLLIKKLKGEKAKNIENSYQDGPLEFNLDYKSDPKSFGIYPKQIVGVYEFNGKDSAYNEVQAIIYDLPGGGNSSNPTWSLNEPHMEQLLCYQQPDSISYTSSAGFEAVTARGTQQPFQFYTNANEIRLSFTLAWHIDELRTFAKKDGNHYTLQDVANIAENFTRPWESGESLTPKLCKVILPGISEIGYITQAQIEYSGDMTGDWRSDFAGLISDNTSGSSSNTENNSTNNSSLKYNSVTNYHYTEIKISFELLIVKEIKLFSEQFAKKGNTWSIEADTSSDTDNLKPSRTSTSTSSSNESDGFSIDSLVSNAREVAGTAATVVIAVGGMTDALSQMSSAAVSLIS